MPPTSPPSRTDQSTTRAETRRGGRGRGDRAGHDAHDGVPGGEEGGRQRHRPVPGTVGDPVRVRAVPGDRLTDSVTDPPGDPAAERGEAERDRGDPDPLDGDGRAVREQPPVGADAQRAARAARAAGVGEEPADDRDRQADQERAARGDRAAGGGGRHQRAAGGQRAPQVGVGTARALAGSSGGTAHRRGLERRHGPPIFTPGPSRTGPPRRRVAVRG
ncbi:hypothetical protein G5V59_23325 [Nocardioides sp. W3-2-3]|uniref:hypothetical protein n=1 Tax=Nocardioides convexus TaxID=2712224 RepID=UPI0024181713|nr:hypothetical protein [Nocardioides convexus]NHA01678.1 hypothetical protein [Nocardioides convexus]